MVSEAYGFPLKPFLSGLCYLWPSPHGARTRDGAPAGRSENSEKFSENLQKSRFEQVVSKIDRLDVASYGPRAAAAAAAAVAAEPPRGSGTKSSKNDLFRTFKEGIPPSWGPRSSVNLADISIDLHRFA